MSGAITVNVNDYAWENLQEEPTEHEHVFVHPVSTMNVHPNTLDSMLEQFETELQQVPLARKTTSESLEEADAKRQELMNLINNGFDRFLNHVKAEAVKSSKTLATIATPQKQEMEFDHPLFDASSLNVQTWTRKRNELTQNLNVLKTQESEYKSRVDAALRAKAHETTVGYHLATALVETLDTNAKLHDFNVKLIGTVYEQQNKLLKNMGNSYVTFYKWLLDQWNRNVQSLSQTYNKVHSQIQKTFEATTLAQPMESLVSRYDAFLKKLPLEFRMTSTPSGEWRRHLARHQPEECLRLMKTELQALQAMPQMATNPAKSAEINLWLRELEQYDVSQLQKQTESRQRVKRRMEDVVNQETQKVYIDKWDYFTNYLYKIGIELQQEAGQRLAFINSIYQQKKKLVDEKQLLINASIYNYESRLALTDHHLAQLLQVQKKVQSQIFFTDYWILAIDSLLALQSTVDQLNKDFNP